MSRIDEALRRVSGDGPVVYGTGMTGSGDAPARHAEATLELYPRESGPAINRPERPRIANRVVGEVVKNPRPAAFAPEVMNRKLVLDPQVPMVCRDQHRRLAAALHEMQVERGLKTLMVTSTTRSEGKTLTISNLALTLTQSYARRVLLIDADLRCPSVHTMLGVPNDAGLSDVLSHSSRDIPLFAVSPRLSVLPAGPLVTNPLAGLTSERMRGLLEDCESRFDWILIDTPPVGLLPDAQLLTAVSQAALFVIRAGATPYEAVEKAIAELGRDHIIGTVLNSVDEAIIPSSAY